MVKVLLLPGNEYPGVTPFTRGAFYPVTLIKKHPKHFPALKIYIKFLKAGLANIFVVKFYTISG